MIEREDFGGSAGPVAWSRRNWRERAGLIVGVAWAVYTLLYLFKGFFLFDIVIYPVVHRAISTAAITVLVFLSYPLHRRGALPVPWLDPLMIVAVIVGCGYVVLFAEELVYRWGDADAAQMVMGVALLLALLEATRRTGGMPIAVLIVAAFFYTVYSDHFPGFLMSVGFSYPRTVGWLYLGAEGLWGTIIGVVSTIVAAFIIFGALLRATGAADFFSDLALSLVGARRGGPAKAAVVASTLFGTISGSIAANVATTGQITIPLMIRSGYRPAIAGAIEAVASTGGMFTPPVMGATAFLIAEFLRIGYWEVCLASALPAALYYLVLLTQVDLDAARHRIGGLAADEVPKTRVVMARGWHFLIPFVVLGVAMGVMSYSAETSILYALVALFVVSFLRPTRRLSLAGLVAALEDSARGMMSIAPLCAAVGVIVGALTLTGTGASLSSALVDVAGGQLFVMLLLAGATSFVLGMGMTAVTCYILTVVLLAPALISAGVPPLAAHMFLFYFGSLSFITPPVAIAAYVAASISGASAWQTGVAAVRLGAAAFMLPFAFVYNPGLLWIGGGWEIVAALLFVTVGACLVAVALAGHLLADLAVPSRLVLFAIGLALMVPVPEVRLPALAVAALLLLRHWLAVRSAATRAVATALQR